MDDNQNPNRKLAARSGGFFQDLTSRFRLISRLIMDERVNPLIKLLPVATLIYVVSPIDFLPVNPIDDAFVIWIGTTLFVELCPPDVVQEHMRSLVNRVMPDQWKAGQPPMQEGDVVDGEFFESGPMPPKPSSK
jgi:uncharacterized membrane protein YkvA (DUF1232 family)